MDLVVAWLVFPVVLLSLAAGWGCGLSRLCRVRLHTRAVYSSDEPRNLHVAYPGQPYQIEVFAPERGLARRLVSGGEVPPVG